MSETYGLDKPLPDDSEAALLEINVIFADRNHPYHARSGHPLRDRATKRVTKLFEIKNRGKFDPVAEQQAPDFRELAAQLVGERIGNGKE